ncbi:MAG: TolC family protein [Bacteroidota bacterium]
MLRYISFLCISLASFVGLQAQDGIQLLSLEDCVQYAQENNLSLKNARFDEYIAASSVKEVTAMGLPQIRASADLNYFVELPTQILPGFFNTQQGVFVQDGQPFLATLIDPETMQPIAGDPIEAQFGFPWQSTVGISAQQLIADGSFFLGLAAAKAYVDLAQRNTERTREQLVYDVTKAYYSALMAEEQLKLLEANLARLETLYNETKVLNENGFVEKIDVDRLQISYTNLSLEREKIKRFAKLGQDLLKFQMGMPIDTEIALTEEISKMVAEPALDPLGSFSAQNRAEYSLLSSQLELESYNYRRHKVGYLPSIYAFGSYQYQAQRDEFNLFSTDEKWFPISVVGLQINIPLFDGLAGYQRMQQSEIKMKQIENQRLLFEQSAMLEARKASSDLWNAYNNVQAYQRNLELAQKVYKVSQIKYKEGVGSSLELNDAETTLQEVEANYLSAVFEYLLAQTDLRKALGEFTTVEPVSNNE